MNKEQALELLRQVCDQYRGTWEEHQLLRKALELLKPEPKAEEAGSKE